MTSPISNALPSCSMSVPEEATSSNSQSKTYSKKEPSESQAFLVDHSYETGVRTSNLEVGSGLSRRVHQLFPELKISGKDLLVEAANCLAVAVLITLAIRCQNITMGDMIEFTENQNKEVVQSTIELIRNKTQKALMRITEQPEGIFIDSVPMTYTPEKERQSIMGAIQNRTQKVMQDFIHQKLEEGHFGGFFKDTGVALIISATICIVKETLKRYL